MNGIAVALAGGLAVLFTALMLLQRSLYAAALCLLAVLLQTAVLFYLSGAALLAFLQVMIYAGAVMVLVVVAIMATPSYKQALWSRHFFTRPVIFLTLAVFLAELAALVAQGPSAAPAGAAPSPEAIGRLLFGPYALATEAVTILMLVSSLAILGRRGEAK